ncbi:hypothetical protein [Streptomyces sp. NPDC014734]|uniref:hypothetical protein n=1 Tax=Streptomyces sp. NPDC014734 TaxID=3364886 RepID=UPI0036F95EFE
MQIHRSRHARGFTVLPNALLQDRRLSYTARGLLADLLSRPDGWSEDGRQMADASPQGRLAVAKALRELTAFGYYRVRTFRRDDGTCVSESHVYDTPQAVPGPEAERQVVPGTGRPGSGGPTAGGAGANPVKDRRKKPSLPGRRRRRPPGVVGTGGVRTGPGEGEPPGMAGAVDSGVCAGGGGDRGRAGPSTAGAHGAAVATLLRAIGPEPRLRLGAGEALGLAPLVSAWLERGYDHRDLAGALLGGLPARIHSASAFLGNRLSRKLPPPSPESAGPVRPRGAECVECRRPIPREGTCRDCVRATGGGGGGDGGGGGSRRDADIGVRARTAVRGRALVRAALRTGGAHVPAIASAEGDGAG